MIFCIKKLKIKVKFRGFEKNILKEIFGYSIFIFLNTLVDKINWSLDQIVLGSVAGTVAVAIYAVAAQINNIYLSFWILILIHSSSISPPKNLGFSGEK